MSKSIFILLSIEIDIHMDFTDTDVYLEPQTKQNKNNNIVPVSVGCNFLHTHMRRCGRTSNPLICGFRFFAVKSSEIENHSVIT